MAVRKPFISIVGAGGSNIVPNLGPAFLGVTITDQEGHESDECVIRMADQAPWNTPPAKGTKYAVQAGWANGAGSAISGGAIGGIYAVETFRKIGDPDEGRSFEVVCRAADFIDKMKKAESGHYDTENGFGTAGKIFEKLAADAGVTARIDADIAAINIPYRARWNQAAIDFAADLADELGAVIKPQNGMLMVRARGAGKSVSGAALPPCAINAVNCYGFEFDIDPRPQHKDVAGPWFDIKAGRLKEAVETTAAEFSRAAMIHPLASEAEAKRAAKAHGKAGNQASGTGSVEMAGSALAQAGARAPLSGFGPGIDELSWEIESATHEISPDEGWMVEVGLRTVEEGS